MKRILFTSLIALFVLQLSAQDSSHVKPAATHKINYYRSSTIEFIFSQAQVKDPAGNEFDPGLRFSGFFNHQEQFHFDFSKAFGIFTGIGIRNVGLVTFPAPGVKIKQRAYSIGVPLAIKLGNMGRRKYLAIGAEAEYFFNYKIKYFINGKKTKSNTWFPDQVNPINPSVFIEIEPKPWFYIRAKYYLLDFLAAKSSLQLPDGSDIPGYFATSKLFYISFGLNIKSPHKAKKVKQEHPKDAKLSVK